MYRLISPADEFPEPQPMPKYLEITGITRRLHDAPEFRVDELGGTDWRVKDYTAIFYIEKGVCNYYVMCRNEKIKVIVATDGRHKYLALEDEQVTPISLLQLPETNN